MTTKKETEQKEEVIVKSGLSEKILTPELIERYELERGLKILVSLPAVPSKVPGKDLEAGFIGLGSGQKLVLACGVEPNQYLTFGKFVALVERAGDNRRASVVLQNYAGGGNSQEVRGQILARLSLKHSAIIVCHGAGGRSIKVPKDVLWTYAYYIDRLDLMTYYMMAKTQLGNASLLAELIEANDGQCVFDVPLDPVNPSK